MVQQTNMTLEEKAGQLLRRLTDGYHQTYGVGSMTCAIYDTAWVAMVAKTVNGRTQWLFPDSFRHLLDHQLPNGGWESYASEVDGILNTMAALLALCKHVANPYQLAGQMPPDMASRLSRATEFLRAQLQQWDVGSTVHVGFEILIPTLLDLLEEAGITFDFKQRHLLMAIRDIKMSKFNVSVLYKNISMTALHSLEAFIGKIDFDRVSHHTVSGSMMGSPSSTAAYLIHRSTWDEESEAYLWHVITAGEGRGNGGVPSAFPSTLFEITWVLSTLLESGFTREALGIDRLELLADILETSFVAEKGIIGFAPLVGADVDDTAKAITTLNLLGRVASPKNMIEEYEAHDHFKTYASERNPSFSANCNVLSALLHALPNSDDYTAQIEKATRFLCNYWWETNGQIKDKWNLSPHYPTLLMAQAFMRLVTIWDQGLLPTFSEQLLKDKVLLVLFQALTRVLQTQNTSGSWGNHQSREPTAYAILVLTTLQSLPFAYPLRPHITSAIEKGRASLRSVDNDILKPEYLWIEKVTYGSVALSNAYVLASLKAPSSLYEFGYRLRGLTSIPMKNVTKFTKFYAQIPLYAGVAEWQLQASLIEGYLFLPQLKRVNRDIFPRSDMEEDKYFEYIPFTWTGANNLEGTFLGANFLYEMMIISFLNYQADEYMEAVVGGRFSDSPDTIRDIIKRIFEEFNVRDLSNGHGSLQNVNDLDKSLNGTNSRETNGAKVPGFAADCADVYKTLQRFVTYVLSHPRVRSSSAYDQRRLRHELKVFLLAHVDQIEDNNRFSKQEISHNSNTLFETPRGSFFDWVRTTSSDHTSCPYSFALVACLFGSGQDFFKTVEAKYIAQDMCRHLATMCRMYNDYGSLMRDRLEKNLNSFNFPEFGSGGKAEADERLKERLFGLAQYERKCLEMSLGELQKVSSDETIKILKMFCNVTDTYGQIYVLKDIASRMTKDSAV